MHKYKHLLPALILFFFSFKSFSQTSGIMAWDAYGMEEKYDTMKSYIGISGNFMFASNCITAQFANYYQGKYFIDSTMSKQVTSQFNKKNYLGFDFDNGITFVHRKDTLFHIPISGYFFALRDRNHADAQFPGDLFNLIFRGNAMYAGQFAHLDNLSTNILHYQQLEFGLSKVYHNYKGSYTVGVALSVLKGQNNLSITTANTRLGTETNGDSLTIDLSANIKQSDTTNSGYSAFNGWGLSTDFFVQYYDSTSEIIVRLDVKDLGLISWNNRSLHNNLDTSFIFSGINVDNLLFGPDSLSNISQDSVYRNAYYAHQIRKSYNTFLPASINLSYRMYLDGEYQVPLDAGINYRLGANSIPFVYGGVSAFITKNMILGGSVSYGGYRKLGFGLNFGENFGKGYLLSLQTQNIESLILPNKITGEAAFLTFKKFF